MTQKQKIKLKFIKAFTAIALKCGYTKLQS